MKQPKEAPQLADLKGELSRLAPDLIARHASPEVDSAYLHWEELRHRNPPEGLDHRTWWLLIKLGRRGLSRALPLLDKRDRPFHVGMPDSVQQLLRSIDRDAAGGRELPDALTNNATRERYAVGSLMEEAITSSQLEGASTTRRVAKEMLETGRPPRTQDERMIANNFQAMEWVRANVARPLTPEAVLELHRIVTLGTLDGGDEGSGRLRRTDETIVVVDRDGGDVVHVPPAADSLRTRVDAMCTFANQTDDLDLHPVIRSVLIHLWVGYDHPFVDGNGRTARALFYWSMLRRGYWLTEFLAISRILRKAPAQYSRAYQLTDTDDNDATYFLLHQLRVIRQAIDDLLGYLRRKSREVREIEERLRGRRDLNHRQLSVLARALREPDEDWTIKQHQRAHRVAYQTARADLMELATKRLLVQRQVGKTFVFSVPPDLEARLKR